MKESGGTSINAPLTYLNFNNGIFTYLLKKETTDIKF